MHFRTILPLKRCLIYRFQYDEDMSRSNTMKPENSYPQDLLCQRNAEEI